MDTQLSISMQTVKALELMRLEEGADADELSMESYLDPASEKISIEEESIDPPMLKLRSDEQFKKADSLRKSALSYWRSTPRKRAKQSLIDAGRYDNSSFVMKPGKQKQRAQRQANAEEPEAQCLASQTLAMSKKTMIEDCLRTGEFWLSSK
ncbi:MAG: hypothetical protein K8F91_04345 [Candidatus Obscuribacterales bacterium]|nr:hypothetical protein [Candidatus Obscuribacterales bacterium]